MSKVDVEGMLEGMREGLERDQADGKLAGLSVERLANAISRPGAANDDRVKRTASAPNLSTRSIGSITLPLDLDIFCPRADLRQLHLTPLPGPGWDPQSHLRAIP